MDTRLYSGQYGRKRALSKRRADSHILSDSSMPSDDSTSEDVSDELATITKAWKRGGVIGGEKDSGVLRQKFDQKLPQEEVRETEEIPEEEYETAESPSYAAMRFSEAGAGSVPARVAVLRMSRALIRQRQEEEETEPELNIPGLPGFVQKKLKDIPKEELGDLVKTVQSSPAAAYPKAGKLFKRVISSKIGSIFAELFIWIVIIIATVLFQFIVIKIFPWETFRLITFVLIAAIFLLGIMFSFSMAMFQAAICVNWLYRGAAMLLGYGHLCVVE